MLYSNKPLSRPIMMFDTEYHRYKVARSQQFYWQVRHSDNLEDIGAFGLFVFDVRPSLVTSQGLLVSNQEPQFWQIFSHCSAGHSWSGGHELDHPWSLWHSGIRFLASTFVWRLPVLWEHKYLSFWGRGWGVGPTSRETKISILSLDIEARMLTTQSSVLCEPPRKPHRNYGGWKMKAFQSK